MMGVFIPRGTACSICDCGLAVYEVGSGETRVIADCERSGASRPSPKKAGIGYRHECKKGEPQPTEAIA